VNSLSEVRPTQRDLRFDTLRGLFLVCMTINHLPTPLRTLTDQSLGIFSAAEGFVFLSGLLAGWVYTRKYLKAGPEGLLSASLGRAKTIYGWHIASFIAALVCVNLTVRYLGITSPYVPQLFYDHPLVAMGLGVVLLHQPGLLDLLPMYCIFVLLLPWVIGGLQTGRRWMVLSVSIAIWAAAQVAPAFDPAVLYPVVTGSFNPFAWQLLFVVGIVIGNARLGGKEMVAHPNPWVIASAAVVVAYGLGLHYYDAMPRVWPDQLFGIMLNKPALGLFRMADFASVAYFVGILAARFPSAFNVRALALLGRHSLVVVAVQSVAVITVLQFPTLYDTTFDQLVLSLAVIALLFAAANAHEGWQERSAEEGKAIGTRQPAAAALAPADGPRTPGAADAVYPGGRQAEGNFSADPVHPKQAPGKRRRTLVAPVLGGDRIVRVREHPVH
jgi:hypothetical protein